MTLSIRAAVPLLFAAERLREGSFAARNLSAGSAGQNPRVHVSGYLQWAEATDDQLRNMFSDTEVLMHVRSQSYWAILTGDVEPFRLISVVNRELEHQADWLDGLTESVRSLERWLNAAPGAFALLDTHVLLHYEPPEQVKWRDVLGADEARLVVPLRVIEELDEKKYTAGRPELRESARSSVAHLWTLLQPTKGGPAAVNGVTIEALLDVGDRARSVDADTDVLRACQELRSTGRRVILVTGDTGMSLRAMQLDVEVVRMPETYLRRKP